MNNSCSQPPWHMLSHYWYSAHEAIKDAGVAARKLYQESGIPNLFVFNTGVWIGRWYRSLEINGLYINRWMEKGQFERNFNMWSIQPKTGLF
jgi:hypothetical protein